MNWARWASSAAGNSPSLTFQPWYPYFALKSLIMSLAMPVVSLPWQKVIVPLGGLFIEFGSMTFAPETLASPPLEPLLLLLLLSLPHAAMNNAIAASSASTILLRATM